MTETALDARLHVVPTLADCRPDDGDPAARLVEVAEPVRFGQDPDLDLAHLRLLRELTSATVRVHWRMVGAPLVDERDHVHLVPPGGHAGEDPVAARWRAGYRYGAYYHRNGPGFVMIKDVRPGDEPVRMSVDGDGARQFRLLAEGEYLRDLAPDTLDALDTAEEAGLAVRGVDRFLLLPYRLRTWPVPFSAI